MKLRGRRPELTAAFGNRELLALVRSSSASVRSSSASVWSSSASVRSCRFPTTISPPCDPYMYVFEVLKSSLLGKLHLLKVECALT
jgi:hypothetical protein